jgi:hypothetical protein
MRQLIESFSPEARQIEWKWIGGIFVFYVAVLLAAAGVFMAHQSARKPAPELAVTASYATLQGPATNASPDLPRS